MEDKRPGRQIFVDADVHRELKVLCARLGVTIQDFASEALRAAIHQESARLTVEAHDGNADAALV